MGGLYEERSPLPSKFWERYSNRLSALGALFLFSQRRAAQVRKWRCVRSVLTGRRLPRMLVFPLVSKASYVREQRSCRPFRRWWEMFVWKRESTTNWGQGWGNGGKRWISVSAVGVDPSLLPFVSPLLVLVVLLLLLLLAMVAISILFTSFF